MVARVTGGELMLMHAVSMVSMVQLKDILEMAA